MFVCRDPSMCLCAGILPCVCVQKPSILSILLVVISICLYRGIGSIVVVIRASYYSLKQLLL